MIFADGVVVATNRCAVRSMYCFTPTEETNQSSLVCVYECVCVCVFYVPRFLFLSVVFLTTFGWLFFSVIVRSVHRLFCLKKALRPRSNAPSVGAVKNMIFHRVFFISWLLPLPKQTITTTRMDHSEITMLVARTFGFKTQKKKTLHGADTLHVPHPPTRQRLKKLLVRSVFFHLTTPKVPNRQ